MPLILTNVAGDSGRCRFAFARANATNIAWTRATVNDRKGTLPRYGFR
ncbi:hypothetical protein C791_8234 [Amycolatopsis azurea DSM 43854]|uniref:Uncharacterized protein n=1 Tax=Amycolatopsis azurea DSM 43854 TaxID=1238180 RepID=M2NKJ5_9PSEU|nr:hypothetical protein C791_8234 [Amycolatopsis azurea DSM 43854]